jgi:type IV secretory pathway TrbF-like protein/predicted MFS family arabinose efflux permease
VAADSPIRKWRLIAFVFLPFVTGYYLAYLFRTISAVIAEPLKADLALGAADLGLLTSVYFLAFAAAQIPIGAMLDRYGPRRVQSALLLVAAAGAALFAVSEDFPTLVIARSMIGLGMAAALTAGLKAIVLWFPRDRVALLNGYMVMLGAFGAITATAPAERLLEWIGWRGLFELLAAATALSAILIHFAVPEHASSSVKSPAFISLKTVYTDLRFWRLAPLSATCVGSAWALQGLWAAPWLTDVEGFDRTGLITQLFVMAVALSAGALLLGTMADRLRRHCIGTQDLFGVVAALFIVAQLALIVRLPVPSAVPWSIIAVVGAGTVLSYAILAEYFPKELAGRANGALNVLHLGWAFIVQYMTGLIIEQWPVPNGNHSAVAYQVAFGLNVAMQTAAFGWFMLPWLQVFVGRMTTRVRRSPACHQVEQVIRYENAKLVWRGEVISARRQAASWRLATLGSSGLCAALSLSLVISAGRAQVMPYAVEVENLSEIRTAAPQNIAPSDAQIAFFLAQFVKNVRSLSTDPIVVRANWFDALNYVTDGVAQTLNNHAREVNLFSNIGLRAVATEVVYLVRASETSFEVRWQEETYEGGTVMKSEPFTGIVEIAVEPPSSAVAVKNPLGLYVRAFTWSADHIRMSRSSL